MKPHRVLPEASLETARKPWDHFSALYFRSWLKVAVIWPAVLMMTRVLSWVLTRA